MTRERLQLALELLKPEDWAVFEEFASAFLSSDYDDLRTVASAGGDEGRDAELYSPTAEPSILLQYSVANDWNSKIKRTLSRVLTTRPGTTVLIYVSNQQIGAGGDAIKKECRVKHGIALDIRDRHWFLDRVLGDPRREVISARLARAIVDPFLASRGVQQTKASPLTSPEAIAAFTYLNLQWQDDVREKGLTKLIFEALVRSTLSGTHTSNRLSRGEVKRRVRALLPDHASSQIDGYVDGALRKLEKKAIRHWTKEDEFCLTHDEIVRLADHDMRSAIVDAELHQHILGTVASALSEVGLDAKYLEPVAVVVQTSLERVLIERSQTFALAVSSGQMKSFANQDLGDAVLQELAPGQFPPIAGVSWPYLIASCVSDILDSNSGVVQEYLRSMVDAHTLFAFLRETPDVQTAVEKMFSRGDIWFDTTALLPLFAESAQDATGRFTRMIIAAREAGLNLFVTEGVLEEIERHMNTAHVCARTRGIRWEGIVPYLLQRFLESGQSIDAFGGWLEGFRGDERPVDDLAEYLEEEYGIQRRSLLQEAAEAEDELRYALEGLWRETHKRRRERSGRPIDEMTLTRLVQHDVECFAGVIQVRKKESDSAFGYTAWWLTLDRGAIAIGPRLEAQLGASAPDSPVMSADFLVNYLAFGPVRRRVAKPTESRLPAVLDIGSARYLTPDLIAEAERIRAELVDMPERIVRRRVRDMLDAAKRRFGPVALAGVESIDDEVAAT